MFSEMKTAERNQARRMRSEEGRSIKEIARLLGVSTSSVSHWVRDIELTDAQHSALQRGIGSTGVSVLRAPQWQPKPERVGSRLSKRVGGRRGA
jgi:transposase-like protein